MIDIVVVFALAVVTAVSGKVSVAVVVIDDFVVVDVVTVEADLVFVGDESHPQNKT